MTAVGAALCLAIGAVLQGAVGFGMALLSVPLLIWVGVPLAEAVPMVLGASFLQTASGAWVARRLVAWRAGLLLGLCQWLTIPLGVLAMQMLSSGSPSTTKQGVGVLVLVLVASRFVLRPSPRDRLHPAWGALAAGSSGFLSGLSGMGGPPLVVYALAHRWRNERYRAFLWSQLALGAPVVAIVLWLRMDPASALAFGKGVVYGPFLWGATYVGVRIAERWDRERMKNVVLVVLLLIGIASFAAPHLELLAHN